MTLCYHKEAFVVGVLSAFFIFAIVTLFEDALKDVIRKLNKRSINKSNLNII